MIASESVPGARERERPRAARRWLESGGGSCSSIVDLLIARLKRIHDGDPTDLVARAASTENFLHGTFVTRLRKALRDGLPRRESRARQTAQRLPHSPTRVKPVCPHLFANKRRNAPSFLNF